MARSSQGEPRETNQPTQGGTRTRTVAHALTAVRHAPPRADSPEPDTTPIPSVALPRWLHDELVDSSAMLGAFLAYRDALTPDGEYKLPAEMRDPLLPLYPEMAGEDGAPPSP